MAQQQIPFQYARGQVCHTTLLVDDVTKAKAFFTESFGWTAKDVSGENPYFMVSDRIGLPVIGIGARDANAPEVSVYVDVGDLVGAAEAVEANGGSLIATPVEVPNEGRFQLFNAPGTAVAFALWENASGTAKDARTWKHERLVGTIVGRPIGCSDPQRTAEFFNAIFGWDIQTESDPKTATDIFVYDDKGGSGGIFYPIEAGIALNPVEVHILVDDLMEATNRATKNGGEVVGAPVQFAGWGVKQDVRVPGGPVIQIWDDATRDR